jgi:hypothetical protein
MNATGMGAVTNPELIKLGHVLGVAPERVAAFDGLADVPAGELRTLRRQIGEALFRADAQHFAKVAALSKAVPTAVAAKLTEHALPPLLAARTAELLDPQRAGDLVKRLPDSYVADVAAAMDPARSPEVIAGIPAERVARVAAELARRGEWVVIGSFVAQVSSAGLVASVRTFDGEQLLRISFVLDELSRLDEIAAALTDSQLDQLLAAAAERGLWAELAALLSNVGEPARERLRARVSVAPDRVAEPIRRAAADGDLGPAARAALGDDGAARWTSRGTPS